jgi:hypothetical protein
MVALLSESLLTLTEASKRLPTRPHAATIWRWYTHGLRGRRLETAIVGGRRVTSVEALERFVAALTTERDGLPVSPPTATRRQRRAAIDAANRTLDAAGI